MSIEMKNYPNRAEWLEARKALGIGASEMATACGQNPYEGKTQLSLWEEHTGRREPFKGNEATERGRMKEPEIRERFMRHWGWLFDLQYDEFGIWINSDYPHQFATLDGILIAKMNAEDINIGNNIINLKKGDRVILEIKSTAPRTQDIYNAWDRIPVEYRYQGAAQMMASGIDRQILVADISGQFQREKPYEERVFYTEAKDYADLIDEIKKTIPGLWHNIETNTAPAQGIDIAQVPLDATLTEGHIISNFEDVKTAITCCADKYRGITFTEAQCKEAKKSRAELNGAKEQIESKRKSVKKQWNEPYMKFEGECKELLQIIDEVCSPIDTQIKAFESAQDERKLKEISGIIEDFLAGDYKDIEPLFLAYGKSNSDTMHGVAVNPKWTNKTMSIQAIREELVNRFEQVRKEYAVIYSLQEHLGSIWDGIYTEYITSGLNLVSAINKKNQLLEAQKALREMQSKAEPEKPVEPQPAPKNEETNNSLESRKIYTKCVEFSHCDISEFTALISYLKQHGFKCREVKEYK